MNRLYIGIDPGKKGALAIIDGENVSVIPFDKDAYIQELKIAAHQPCVCCLERVGAMPGQGVTSMFNFGYNAGGLDWCLSTLGIPFELVTPQKWKKEFGVSGKNESVTVCKRLFPGVSLLATEKCRKDSDGMAEAILMAEYARRRL